MAITLLSQNFFKELSSGSVNWLLGNVGDKIRVETTISIINDVIASNDNPFIVNNNDGYIGNGWLTDAAQRFVNFNIGDYVYYYNYSTSTANGYYYIIAKQDNGTIQLNSAANGSGSYPTATPALIDAVGVISNATPITAIKYHYNYINNSAADTFISQVDGTNEQVFITESKLGSDTTTTQMLPLGPLTWQDGTAGSTMIPFGGGTTSACTITGICAHINSSGVYETQYKIVHYTKIPPFILVGQIANQEDGIAPADFLSVNNCWKFITQIDAMQDYTNPNNIVTQIFDSVNGNTGWYGENFNTGKTNYSIGGLSYTNGGTSTPSLHIDTSSTTVNFNIINTTDTPFTSSTKFILHFFKVPSDPSEYQNNAILMDQNFCYDRALQQVGASAVNGDNYGGTFQVLTDVVATLTDSGHIAVSAVVSMNSNVVTICQESSNPMYFLAVSVQNASKTTSDGTNDLVSLQVDMNTFTEITTDPGMIVFDSTRFLRHPEGNPATDGVVVGAPAGDPSPESYTINPLFSSFPTVVLCIKGNTNALACAAWTTDLNTTLALLVTSLNTNTNHGTLSGLFTTFGNSQGFTASYNSSTSVFTITPPAGSGTLYNGVKVSFAFPAAGGFSTTPIFAVPFSGGLGVTLDTFPQDEIVACTDFYIESNGRPSDVIKLTNINAKIVASNGTSTFELDQFLMNVSSIPLTGNTQQFDSQIARVFNVPVGTIRKYIEVQRRNDLDTGTRWYFSIYYPFMVRWETWTAVLGVDASFFNASLPNNGFNQWWYQYGQSSGWSLYYELIINATENGNAQSYTLQIPFLIHNYSGNSAYTVKQVMSFHASGLAALQSGSGGAIQYQSGGSTTVVINGQTYYIDGNNVVFADQKVLLVAIFTKTSAPSTPTVEFKAEVYQQGGIAGERVYSSKWVSDGNTWFSSTDGSGMVVVEEHGDSVVAYCYFDPTTANFPKNAKYISVAARIYEAVGGLTTDDGVSITTDDGVQIQVD